MGGSCGLVPVILVLILTVTGTEAQCTSQEVDTLFQCINPYNQKFFAIVGAGGSCNRTLISDPVCTDFAAIVVCANQKNVSRTTCRPHAVGQINEQLKISCKVADFKEVCLKAPAMDIGDDAGASGVGISLGLLGAVILVSMIAQM